MNNLDNRVNNVHLSECLTKNITFNNYPFFITHINGENFTLTPAFKSLLNYHEIEPDINNFSQLYVFPLDFDSLVKNLVSQISVYKKKSLFKNIPNEPTPLLITAHYHQNLVLGIVTLPQQIESAYFIPICANCSFIREEIAYEQVWMKPADYFFNKWLELRNYDQIEFTHGICPKCVTTLYPDFKNSKNVKP